MVDVEIFLFRSLMSEIKRNVMSSFGIRNVGAPQWEQITFFTTLGYSSQYSSCLNVSSCMRGTGKGFPLYGSASVLSLIS